jgi:broad specificity phosphatase PhoE
LATLVYLVRHAAHAVIDRVLVGRGGDVALSMDGLKQAQCLARRFAGEAVACVQSSPQLRARQTATEIARSVGKLVEIVNDVDEVDMGAWTGSSFEELEKDPSWRRWNTMRSSARIPDGEDMKQVQHRVVRHLMSLRAAYPGQQVVIVSHAEPIRAAVMHYRGVALDDFMTVQIDPGSVTTVRLQRHSGQIVGENERFGDVEAA